MSDRSLATLATVITVLLLMIVPVACGRPGPDDRHVESAPDPVGSPGPAGPLSCALGFSWTLDCERVLAGGVSR